MHAQAYTCAYVEKAIGIRTPSVFGRWYKLDKRTILHYLL